MTAVNLDLSGWVLRKPKVAESNAPTTSAPDNMTLSGFVPSDRSDYLIVALDNGFLHEIRFAWVKNEGRSQFGFSDEDQRWKPFPGRSSYLLGALSNTERLIASPIPDGIYPYRFYILDPSSSSLNTFNIVTSFSSPSSLSSGEVEVLESSGELNFSQDDVNSFEGEMVYYQGESFVDYTDENKAILGVLDSPLSTYRLALNPIPDSTQIPIIRIGNRVPLEVVSVATETGFGIPSAGTVEWSRDKGTLNFSSDDILSYQGESIYYWGVYDHVDSSAGLSSNIYDLGSIDITDPLNPTTTSSIPSGSVPDSGGDIIVYFVDSDYHRISKTTIVSSFSDTVKFGEAELKTDGTIRLNYAEARSYVGWDVYLVVCDYELSGEDIAVRYFRSLINKDGSDSDIPDLSCFYSVEDQVLVDKLIASPIQILPVAPIEPPLPSYIEPSFKIDGNTTVSLQNLKENSSNGPGFLIDYDSRELTIARRTSFDVELESDSIFYNFEDVGLLEYDFDLKTGPLVGPNTDLTLGDDYLLESNGGAVFFINRFGKTLDSGTKGEITSTVLFEDATADFTGYSGQQLVILSGTNKGSYIINSVISTTEVSIDSSIPFSVLGSKIVYEIWDVPEILANRVWEEVPIPEDYFKLEKLYPIGSISNSPRLTIPIVDESARIGLNLDTVSLSVSWVDTDGDFGTPSGGVAEISKDTGNINFSASDLSSYASQDVWVSWWLYPSEYLINSSNGSVYLNTPLLNWEKLQASYYIEEGGDLQEEFLKIRLWGEECSVTPGSTEVPFNTDDRETNSDLGIYVYRGNVNTSVGRFYSLSPTQTSDKVVVDWSTNTLTFIDPLTSEDEVTVEYYVLDALGGEQAFNLTNFPIFFPSYSMSEGSNSFEVYGDMTSVFTANKYILIEGQDVYCITSSSYASDKTTVLLTSEFRDSYLLENFLISDDFLGSSYFNPVSVKFETTQKGSYELRFKDVVSNIAVGSILNLDGDDYLVLGSNVIDGVTVVQVGSKFPSEYSYSIGILESSVLPVFPNNATEFVSSLPIVSTEPFALNKRNESLGTFDELVLDIDYSLSESGALLLLTTTVTSGDSLEFNYAGQKTYAVGQKFSGQYIYRYVPDATNKYLGSSLIASYTVYNPDSFYFRVEPFSTIANEVSVALGEAAESSLPSSGPPSPPPPPPDIYEKGKSTFYWEYGSSIDEDAVARRYLLYYNDLCNSVEDLLSYLDGRVIGDKDGKFKFTDSLYTTPVEPSSAVNNIDSVIYISPATFPDRKYQPMWKASSYSRLYPEFERFFGQTIPTSGGGPGYDFPDEFLTAIFDIGRENLAVVSSVKDRPARTLLLNTILAGQSSAVLEVENADEDSEFFTPKFEVGDEVMIGRVSSLYLVAGIITAVDTVSTPNTISVDFVSYNTTPTSPPPSGTTCPELLPNDTVYHNPFWWEDDGDGNLVTHLKMYQNGLHYAPDLKAGTLLNMQLPGFNVLFPETNLDGLTSFGCPLTAPYRFPALDGQILNDDGDRSVPFRISATSNFDGLFEDEEGLIDDIIDETLEGVRGTDGAVLSDLQTFDGSWSAAVLEANDLLILTTGSNIGQYLVSSIPATDKVKVTAFEHRQDDTVDYEIWDATETTLRASGVAGTILLDLLSLEDLSKNFSTAGVIAGDKVIINSVVGYFNTGTYWVQTVATTEVSVRAFSVSETGIEFDIKRGVGRISGDTGYFNTVSQFIDVGVNFETANLVKGDCLVVTEGKNRGNWRIDSVDDSTHLTLQDSVRVAEIGSGNIVSPNVLNITGVVFQSSDVGRKIVVSSSTDNDGTYTIASFIDENSVTLSPNWSGTTPDTCNWSLCCDYKVDDTRRESQYITDWRAKLLEEQTDLQSSSFQDLIENLFDTFYGVSPFTSGTGAVTGLNTFQDVSKDFDGLGVVEGDVLDIDSGANAGKWWIESVSGDTITISGDFPSIASGLSYEVWQGNTRFSLDFRSTLIDLIAMVDLALVDISATLPYSIIDTNPDYGDPTDTFLNARKTDIQNFRSDFSELPTRFETALQYIDKWYDKRYGWIDYRVNLEQGTLPIKERLISEKEKTEADLIKKLLMSLG